MANAPLQIVWFKRDLRIQDHAPLAEAAKAGPVLPLYITEPALWQQADMAQRHWDFIGECVAELAEALQSLGQDLVIRHGEAVDVLSTLIAERDIGGVWSHQETGNGWTFERDKAVGRLLQQHGIHWREFRQHGIVRGAVDRDRWSKQWEAFMGEAIIPPPAELPVIDSASDGWIASPIPNLPNSPCPGRQQGGRRAGEAILDGFLHQRGKRYHMEMSSPVTAVDSCSRLSAHLAWGTLSMREVVQATRQRRAEVKALPAPERATWPRALSSFEGRLHWHCHFMQKLETEPRIEFSNMQRSMNGLREEQPDPQRLMAWAEGRTGWPFVDACMRCLRETGWINFRMRAMLMSVASYHLWLHWRETSLHLARLFTDYEPGIHYPQAQMQSGTTGINTARIYNPIKQSMDQDPNGEFIRRWLPELEHVSDDWIHTPWKMPTSLQRQYRCDIGTDYPQPLLDHEQAAREARQQLSAFRKRSAARSESKKIYEKHGSRKRPATRRSSKPKQQELEL